MTAFPWTQITLHKNKTRLPIAAGADEADGAGSLAIGRTRTRPSNCRRSAPLDLRQKAPPCAAAGGPAPGGRLRAAAAAVLRLAPLLLLPLIAAACIRFGLARVGFRRRDLALALAVLAGLAAAARAAKGRSATANGAIPVLLALPAIGAAAVCAAVCVRRIPWVKEHLL
jgi:hypothetical protein